MNYFMQAQYAADHPLPVITEDDLPEGATVTHEPGVTFIDITKAVPALSSKAIWDELETREMMQEEARTDRQTAYELEEREGQCWCHDGECIDNGGYCDWRSGDCLRSK